MRSSPPIAFAAFMQIANPRPRPVRSWLRCVNGFSRFSTFPGGRPPHSSSTEISTRSVVVLAPSLTVVSGLRELERVLHQVGDRRSENLSVGLDNHRRVNRRHLELKPTLSRDHRGPDLDLLENLAHGDAFDVLHTRVEAHVRERSIDEADQPLQAAGVNDASASPGRDGALLDAAEGEDRGVRDVPHLVREEPESLGSGIGDRALA